LVLAPGPTLRQNDAARTNDPPVTQRVEVTARPTVEQARGHLENGEPDKALVAFSGCDSCPAVMCGRGQARWLAYLRHQKQLRQPLDENDPEVSRARQDLIAAKSAEGALWLGLINEAFGQFDSAREAYTEGRNTHPERGRLFAAALSRLEALSGNGTRPVATRIDPQLGLALSMIVM